MKKIILFCLFVFCITCFGDAKLDKLKKDKEVYESAIVNIDRQTLEINAKPDEFVQKKLNELNKWTEKIPDRKVQPGRVSMNKHLNDLSDGIKKNPKDYRNKELKRLDGLKKQYNLDLANINLQISNAK
jgi:hypothetical protein